MKYSFLSFFCLISFLGFSQTKIDTSLATPYSTIFTHLHFLQVETYIPSIAAKTIPPPNPRAEQLIIQLKQILDGKGLYVRMNMLPQNADYLDSLSQNAYYTPFPELLPEVYLEKINNKWYYSSETVNAIPQLHRKVYPFGSDVLLNILPQMGQQKIGGLATWQYLGILFLLIFAFILYLIFSRIIRPIIDRLIHLRNNPIEGDQMIIRKISRYTTLFLLVYLLKMMLPILQLPPLLATYVITSLRIIQTVFGILLFLRIGDLGVLYLTRLSQQTSNRLDEQIMPILKRIFQLVIVLGGIIHILNLLDINVTALIAGVSIGGLALALAAQDTVKNLIGSIMIFIDRPFQIGDYIEWGVFSGVVNEVGFRTTRIQLADSSIISVPNGTIANVAVTNKGVRVYRLFKIILNLTYTTPPDKIEHFIHQLEQLILNHPLTAKENYYVRLVELSASSIDILFRANLLVDSYAIELESKQEFLLAILRLAQQEGINFAYPSSTIYLENGD